MANGSVARYVEARRQADALRREGNGLRSIHARLIETARFLAGIYRQLDELEETATALWNHYESLDAELARRTAGLVSLRSDMLRQDEDDSNG